VALTLQRECSEVTDYVMIQGAWQGGWCWKRVRNLLMDILARGFQDSSFPQFYALAGERR
jgi:hypothetical protein